MKGKTMSQSIYSVYGSRIHLLLEDEFASNWNKAQAAFFKAQKDHLARTGTQWTGNEHLAIDLKPEELKAFNDFAELMNLMIKLNGGTLNITEEEMTDDYLIKVL